MKILVIGNQGYLGSVVTQRLGVCKEYIIDGLDTAFYSHCITSNSKNDDFGIRHQYFKDVRDVSRNDLKGYDAIVYLAALSNDPMGKVFQELTIDINYKAAIKIASKAMTIGVNHFIFASSCSVYGYAEGMLTERSNLAPLTTYASTKINVEKELKVLESAKFRITCLRFATACGWSPRLRLDLVLNDFVASAISSNRIKILSDGSPWRPIIHVGDMTRAIEWALNRTDGLNYLIVNVGRNDWNFRISDLAIAVKAQIPNTKIEINTNAIPDHRSYKVDFSLFKELAPNNQPIFSLSDTIRELVDGLSLIEFNNIEFRKSNTFIRLNTLKSLQIDNQINKKLKWISVNDKN